MRRSPLRRTPLLRRRPKPGSGISPENRVLVRVRDRGYCVRCGAWLANVPGSIHHRLPRGRGGDDRVSGLVLLCGTGTTGCHGDVERDRAQAYDDGFLVTTGTDPSTVPVLTWEGWRYLLDDCAVITRDEYRQRITRSAS